MVGEGVKQGYTKCFLQSLGAPMLRKVTVVSQCHSRYRCRLLAAQLLVLLVTKWGRGGLRSSACLLPLCHHV